MHNSNNHHNRNHHSFAAEIGVIKRVPTIATMRAKTVCRSFKLTRAAFEGVMRNYPAERARLEARISDDYQAILDLLAAGSNPAYSVEIE